MKQLLNIEQSIALREQVKKQEEIFQKITGEKDEEIKILKLELEETRKIQPKILGTTPTLKENSKEETNDDKTFKKLFSNPEHIRTFKEIKKWIDSGYQLQDSGIAKTMIDFFEVNNLIDKDKVNSSYHTLTSVGKVMYKILLNKELGVE